MSFSTLIADVSDDNGWRISITVYGAYVVGSTTSRALPTFNVFQDSHAVDLKMHVSIM